MSIIWKYELENIVTIINMPVESHILSIQKQKDKICMWVLLNPKLPKKERIFRMIVTSEEFDANSGFAYLGTVQTHDEEYVAHIFEKY